jgi:hypothetical protein
MSFLVSSRQVPKQFLSYLLVIFSQRVNNFI